MSNPLISIVCPLYNAERFITLSLQSALNQSFQDFEIIVVDDGSSDRSSELVNKLISKDSRITLLQEIHHGIATTRNIGIKRSHGELIAFLDADDLWHPDKLSQQLSSLRQHPEAGIISCLSVLIDEENKILGWIGGVNLNGMVYKHTLERNGISCGSIPLIKKECLYEVGLFDPKLTAASDWDCWIKITKHYPLFTIPKPLVGYRRSAISTTKNYDQIMEDSKNVLKKIDNISKRFYNYCLSRCASTTSGLCIVDKNLEEAWKYMIQSIKIDPLSYLKDFHRLKILLLLILITILPHNIRMPIINYLIKLTFKSKPGKQFDLEYRKL